MLYRVQHHTPAGWVDFADSNGKSKEFPSFLDASEWLTNFIFGATEEMLIGLRRPDEGYDPTLFQIVDVVRNDTYRMNADQLYVRGSDGVVFDVTGDPVNSPNLPPVDKQDEKTVVL